MFTVPRILSVCAYFLPPLMRKPTAKPITNSAAATAPTAAVLSCCTVVVAILVAVSVAVFVIATTDVAVFAVTDIIVVVTVVARFDQSCNRFLLPCCSSYSNRKHYPNYCGLPDDPRCSGISEHKPELYG